MFIGNPKVRNKVNSLIDNMCFGVYLLILPFAILFGGIVGLVSKIFKWKKGELTLPLILL